MAKLRSDYEFGKQTTKVTVSAFRGQLIEAIELAKANPGVAVDVNEEEVRKNQYYLMTGKGKDNWFTKLSENAEDFAVEWDKSRERSEAKDSASGKSTVYTYWGYVVIKFIGKPVRTPAKAKA